MKVVPNEPTAGQPYAHLISRCWDLFKLEYPDTYIDIMKGVQQIQRVQYQGTLSERHSAFRKHTENLERLVSLFPKSFLPISFLTGCMIL